MPCFNLKTKKKRCGVNYERGQSLIELVVAIGIFVIVISVLVFLILNSYISGRLASEITQANFLAEEGLETARSIRDNSWDDLSNGIHYLDDSTGNWRFTDQPKIIDEKFERVINVEEIDPDNPDPDRKKVTSQVTWQFTEARPQEVSLVTYLTNWQKITAGYCAGTCTPCEDIFDSKICRAQDGCGWSGKLKICFDDPDCTPCENYTTEPKCTAQSGCQWITP